MAEPKKEKKTKKPVRTPALQELAPRAPRAPGALAGSAAGAVTADVAGSIDPYLSRNEFKEGFYDQPKPPVSYETLKGTAAKPIPNVTDTESFADGGSVRGQKNIQVKKKPFKGIF
jgi:hypothetical protein